MKHLPLLLLTLALCLLLAPPASAANFTLTDGTSTATINPASQFGMFDWVIDGYDVMYQQWFWYRVGNAGPESSIDTLTLTSAVQPIPQILQLNYTGTGFSIAIQYTLHDPYAGDYGADIAEQISIHNTGTTSLAFHFFQYSDFDLAKDLNDVVAINDDYSSVVQRPVAGLGGGPMMTETTESSHPDHAEANYFANTRNALTDGGPTMLNGVKDAGPGDVTWAFEWDRNIGFNGTLTISKDKVASYVPEPAAVTLLGGVLLFVASKLRKRIS